LIPSVSRVGGDRRCTTHPCANRRVRRGVGARSVWDADRRINVAAERAQGAPDRT
jgi:hypothetical protein